VKDEELTAFLKTQLCNIFGGRHGPLVIYVVYITNMSSCVNVFLSWLLASQIGKCSSDITCVIFSEWELAVIFLKKRV
jgi:hypothetical protein